jgi:hypothetical protein
MEEWGIMTTGDYTTVIVAGVSVASNAFTIWQARKQSSRQKREDWRSTTGRAYANGRRALRGYIGAITDSALAHAPNRKADFPHYISITEADAHFNHASAVLADAYEEIDQYGTEEVRELFDEALRRVQVLPVLRGRGLYPTESSDQASDQWVEAHRRYREAFDDLRARMALERDTFDQR